MVDGWFVLLLAKQLESLPFSHFISSFFFPFRWMKVEQHIPSTFSVRQSHCLDMLEHSDHLSQFA